MIQKLSANRYEVVVIGGSYAGLSSALALGRALRHVLVIDSGKPCNAQTPESHNFLTQDGRKPAEITLLAKTQIEQYASVSFSKDEVIQITGADLHFKLYTAGGLEIHTQKIILATGVIDLLPEIKGISACWGISAIHCPYCHGYEYRNERTGILMNGDAAFEQARLLRQWSKQLWILSNGKSTLTVAQQEKLAEWEVAVIETEISALQHTDGYLYGIAFKDGGVLPLKALYTRPILAQQKLIADLNCQLNESGYIEVDDFQKTSQPGIYAVGDNSTMMRAVANAVVAGSKAGAFVNRELLAK